MHNQDTHKNSFLEFFSIMWKRKAWVISITMIFLIIGGTYAFTATPTYEGKVYLTPPSDKNTAELRKLNLVSTQEGSGAGANTTPVDNYSSPIVYKKFLQTLNSNAVKRQFFSREDVQSYFGADTSENLNAWRSFNQSYSISQPASETQASVTVVFHTSSPMLSALWANEYVAAAIAMTRDQLFDELQSEIASRKDHINLTISNLRNLYQSDIEAELSKLEEALRIAKSLGLTEPLRTDSVSVIDEQSQRIIEEVRRLYKHGSNALEAEIAALQSRKTHDRFIPGLSEALQQQASIYSVNVSKEKIQPTIIDMPALTDSRAIKPRKMILLILSSIFGLIFGLLTAFLLHTVETWRDCKA